jgi:metallo-beta-lactamase family protein
MIELEFNGAAGCTTGSMHLLRCDGHTISLDCGMFQGHRYEVLEQNRSFPLSPRQIDTVLLSHAHIDHSGRLPLLVKNGFAGKIYSTPATHDLCQIMLTDSAHIQEEDADFWNRKHEASDQIQPLYTAEDAFATLPMFAPVDYNVPFRIGGNCRVKFVEAGHLLGSAMTLIEMPQDGRTVRLLFSGDVGRFNVPILRDPIEPLPDCDYLITECTYADRRHDNVNDMKAKLCKIITETRAAGGKVIIPSFSVGRTQEVIYYLLELFSEGALDPIPVYVDSPLSAHATEVFARHPECYDREALAEFGRESELFSLTGTVHYLTDVTQSKTLNNSSEPCVIMAASGMCESGRILHHLKNNIENPKNTVVVVGFMAQHTLGRRIVERREELKIFGKMYKLLARVEILNGLSAHADSEDFRRLYAPLADKVRGAFVVHGEEKQPPAMKAMLESLGFPRVDIPVKGQKFRLD